MLQMDFYLTPKFLSDFLALFDFSPLLRDSQLIARITRGKTALM